LPRIKVKHSVALTVEKRNELIKTLNNRQKAAISMYKRYQYNSAFHNNNFLRNTDWVFVNFNEDAGFERAFGNHNLLKCKCGRGIKYQFVVKSKSKKHEMALGISHFAQHLGIPQEVANEVRKGINKIDQGVDEVLRKYSVGRRFQQELYDEYVEMDLNVASRKKFNGILKEFSQANLPLARVDHERLTSLVSENRSVFMASTKGKKTALLKQFDYEIWLFSSKLSEKEIISLSGFITVQDVRLEENSIEELESKLNFISKITKDYISYRNKALKMQNTLRNSCYKEAINKNDVSLAIKTFFEVEEWYRKYIENHEEAYKAELFRLNGLKHLKKYGKDYVNQWNEFFEKRFIHETNKPSELKEIIDEKWLPVFKSFYGTIKRYDKMIKELPNHIVQEANLEITSTLNQAPKNIEEIISNLKRRNRILKVYYEDYQEKIAYAKQMKAEAIARKTKIKLEQASRLKEEKRLVIAQGNRRLTKLAKQLWDKEQKLGKRLEAWNRFKGRHYQPSGDIMLDIAMYEFLHQLINQHMNEKLHFFKTLDSMKSYNLYAKKVYSELNNV
jgi:hypothetical protein